MFEAIDESRAIISPWMGWLTPAYQPADVELWVAQAITAWLTLSSYEFAIYDSMDGSVVGACGLNQINQKDRFCNLGYWVRKSKTRLGAATQSVLLLQEFAFAHLHLNRLEIVVADGNQASRGVAEKSGALYEGLHRSRACVGDKIHDAHIYALIRPR